MNATSQLKEEHQAVKLALKILGKVCKKLESKESVDRKHLENILEFLQVFVDRCHHTKEEELLFPAMEKAGVPKEGGPIGMMLEEHDLGRGYLKKMSRTADLLEFAKNARNYIALLNDHIDKEDNILYMIADMHLTDSQQRGLLIEFDKIEEEKVGMGKHEQFHKMLEDLEKL